MSDAHHPRRRCWQSSSAGVEVVDLGRPLRVGMPQSPEPPAVLAHAAPPPRRHGARRRRQRRQRHDHDRHPRRHPHRRALARVPRRQDVRRDRRRRGAGRAASTTSWACTPSRRWCAAASSSTSRRARGVPRCAGGDEITVDDLEAALEGAGRRDPVGRRGPDPQRLGPALRRGRAVPGSHERCPRDRRGRRAVAGRPRRRTPSARTRSPSSGWRPAAGTALLPAHRVLLVESGIYIVEALDLEELAAPAVLRVHVRARAAEHLRRHRVPGASARGGGAMTEPTLAQQLAAFAAGTSYDDLPATVVDSVRQRVLDTLGIAAAAAHRWRPAAPPAAGPPRRAARAGHRVGVPTRRCPPPWRPSSTACSRTPSTTTTPTCRRCCTRAPASCPRRSRRPSGPAPTASSSRAPSRSGSRPASGSAWPATTRRRRTPSSSSTASTPRRSAARWAARWPQRALGAGRKGVLHSLGVTASMASGIIEANRTGGTVKRLHCGWAAHAAVTAAELVRRAHRPADGPGGQVRLLPGVAAWQVRRHRDQRRARLPLAGARHLLQALPGEPLHPRCRGRRDWRCASRASPPSGSSD